MKRYTPVVSQQQLQSLFDKARQSLQQGDMAAFRSSMQTELKSFDGASLFARSFMTFAEYCTMTYNVFYQKIFGIIKGFGLPSLNPKTAEAEADSLAAGLIEFNNVIGTQFRLYLKMLSKFEKAVGGDADAV